MRDLPTSTKILISAMVFLFISLGIYLISNSSNVRDVVSIQDLKELKVENPEKVLEKYKSFKSEEEADSYIREVVDKVGNTLSDKENKLFKDNLVLSYVNVNDKSYTETAMYINYNKMKESDEDFNVIKEYMKNENSYPVKIIYATSDTSMNFGRFIYGDLKAKEDENFIIEDYNTIKIPKAFLVIDGDLKKTYDNYNDMNLKN